jgi:hypothetical protein
MNNKCYLYEVDKAEHNDIQSDAQDNKRGIHVI